MMMTLDVASALILLLPVTDVTAVSEMGLAEWTTSGTSGTLGVVDHV